MTKVFYLPAIAGAGKTESAIDHAIAKAREGEKMLFLQPTLALIDQTEQRIKERGYDLFLYKVTSENQENSVVSGLNDVIDKADTSSGCILLATHAAWIRFRRKKLSEWTVIWDEAPPVFYSTNVVAALTHPYLTDHLEVGPPKDSGYALVWPNEKDGYARLRELKAVVDFDQGLTHLQDPVERLLFGMKTYVHHESYTKLISGEGARLMMYQVLRPGILTGFKRAVVMAVLISAEI